jgi:uncharacterized protein (UPF0332 family)
MNAREFRALALELLGAGTAAKNRSAISRAYYSAFHVGVETLLALGFRVGRGGAAHGEVARCFMNSDDSDTRNAGILLSSLHTLRIRADYQLDRFDIEQSTAAKTTVREAQSVIESFDRILISPQRPQIQSAIAVWRKSNGYP